MDWKPVKHRLLGEIRVNIGEFKVKGEEEVSKRLLWTIKTITVINKQPHTALKHYIFVLTTAAVAGDGVLSEYALEERRYGIDQA
mgnify:CR=1 FL=1|jgi:hypothetical protein